MAKTEARRLESWKEISAHLDRTVRTVQRWESQDGLPTHRHVHQDQSSVYAFTDELDDWLKARSVSKAGGGGVSTVPTTGRAGGSATSATRRSLPDENADGRMVAGRVRELQSAIALDPTDPLSHAALAQAYCVLSGNEIWRWKMDCLSDDGP